MARNVPLPSSLVSRLPSLRGACQRWGAVGGAEIKAGEDSNRSSQQLFPIACAGILRCASRRSRHGMAMPQTWPCGVQRWTIYRAMISCENDTRRERSSSSGMPMTEWPGWHEVTMPNISDRTAVAYGEIRTDAQSRQYAIH